MSSDQPYVKGNGTDVREGQISMLDCALLLRMQQDDVGSAVNLMAWTDLTV